MQWGFVIITAIQNLLDPIVRPIHDFIIDRKDKRTK